MSTSTNDFFLPFEEEPDDSADFAFSKSEFDLIEAAFADDEIMRMKAYMANVLNGHQAAKPVTESVDAVFMLRGFCVKETTFKKSGTTGYYTLLFGSNENKQPCAFWTTSNKLYDALETLIAVYGRASAWGNGIKVQIRMNQLEKGKSYSLEVV